MSKSKISVRPADMDDLPVLFHFQLQLAEETEGLELDRTVLEDGLRALLSDCGKGRYFIATLDGDIAGCYMITHTWDSMQNGNTSWLQSVYIKPAYRRRGVFRAMYENLKTLTNQEPSITGLRLYVDNRNERAQKTYTACGMDGARLQLFEYLK